MKLQLQTRMQRDHLEEPMLDKRLVLKQFLKKESKRI